MMKDVRAMIAIGNLEALGTITSITPSKEAIDEGKFDGSLDLRIASDAGEEALRTAALGTEIASVEIKPAVKQESAPERRRMPIKNRLPWRTRTGRSNTSGSISTSSTTS